VDVKLPRPRRIGDVRNTPDFSLVSHHVWELLQDKSPEEKTPRAEIDIGEEILPDTVI
jgi:NitT/TauT family transport system ATP-binding protein